MINCGFHFFNANVKILMNKSQLKPVKIQRNGLKGKRLLRLTWWQITCWILTSKVVTYGARKDDYYTTTGITMF